MNDRWNIVLNSNVLSMLDTEKQKIYIFDCLFVYKWWHFQELFFHP